MRIVQIPALSDNYNYLLLNSELGEAICVDPSTGEPILEHLRQEGYQLKQIWNTHHHHDHVGGNLDLQSQTGAEIWGPPRETIPGRSQIATPQSPPSAWGLQVEVLPTPGHTLGHIAYHLPELKALFSGDVLFSMGCGRLFEGTPQQAYQTLLSLLKLPPDTLVHCAHEYSLINAEFALKWEPGNKDLVKRYQEVLELRARKLPTVPTTLKQELTFNPFLRAHSMEIRHHLGLPNASDLEVFTRLRKLRNTF